MGSLHGLIMNIKEKQNVISLLILLIAVLGSVFLFINVGFQPSIFLLIFGILVAIMVLLWQYFILLSFTLSNLMIIFLINYIYYINQDVSEINQAGIFFLLSLTVSLLVLIFSIIIAGKYLNININKTLGYQILVNITLTPTILFLNFNSAVLIVPLFQIVAIAVAILIKRQKLKRIILINSISPPQFLQPYRKNPAYTMQPLKEDKYYSSFNINGNIMHVCRAKENIKITATNNEFILNGVPSGIEIENLLSYINSTYEPTLIYKPINVIIMQDKYKDDILMLHIKNKEEYMKKPSIVLISKSIETIVPFLK
jgi:hypothetical protein